MKSREAGICAMALAGIILPCAGLQAQATSNRRIALVIGNQNYTEHPLSTPIADVRDMTNSLKSAGFEVQPGIDLTGRAMDRLVNDFSTRIRQGDVVLFYYSGHGIEAEGQNYLLPTDFHAVAEDEVKDRAFPVSRFLSQIRKKRARVSIVILDACRDNPFRRWRGGRAGLAELSGEFGEYIAFAAAPGKSALDNSAGGRNGLFTKHLVSVLASGGSNINDVFDAVRLQVYQESHGSQVPWSSTGLVGAFYFRPGQGRPMEVSQNHSPADVSGAGSRGFGAAPECAAASSRQPASEGDFYQLAKCDQSSGKYAETIAALNEAIKINGGNADYHYLRGIARVQLRQFPGAAADFKHAIELDPEKPDYHLELGRLQDLEGNYEEASVSLRNAYNLAQNRRDICNALADVLEKKGLRRMADDLRQKAASLN